MLYQNDDPAVLLARCYKMLFQIDTREDLDFVPAYLVALGRFDIEWEIRYLEAQIAKIPFALASHIARCFKP